MLSKKQKTDTIKKFARKEGDTGSPEVQIALLTKQIKELTLHLKKHRKDKHSRRGLLQMVGSRQRHLRFLKKKSEKKYNETVKSLGL